MINSKKIVSGFVLSSLLFSFFQPSFAQNDGSVSKDEISKVENEILSLQSTFSQKLNNFINTTVANTKQLSKYEETGDSSFDLHIDEDSFGTAKANMNMKDYNVKANMTESEIATPFAFNMNYSPIFGSGMTLTTSGNLSFINKEGQSFALLKDFEYTVDDSNLEKTLAKLKDTFKDNKYLKLPSDQQSKILFQAINQFSSTGLTDQVTNLFSKPLFTTYKKLGDKYLLIPTKYACDSYFQINNQINGNLPWYEPSSCTDDVYRTAITRFVQSGELSLTLGQDGNTFAYFASQDGNVTDFQIKYLHDKIVSIDFVFTPDQKEFKNEYFNVHYAAGSFLTSGLNSNNGAYTYNFTSQLDSDDHFTDIDANLNFDKDMTGKLVLKNKNISGLFILKQNGYDYSSENWDYKLKNVYGLKISGTMDTHNQLQTLGLQGAGIDIATKKPFVVGNMTYSQGDVTAYVKYDDDDQKFLFNGSGHIDKNLVNISSTFNFDDTYSGKVNYALDRTDNKDNIDMNVVVNNGTKDIFTFHANNTGKRIYKDNVEIQAPVDTVDMDTLSNWIDEDSNNE